MSYRPVTDSQTRIATMAMVVVLHAALVALSILLSVNIPKALSPTPVDIFDVTSPVPPPPIEHDDRARDVATKDGIETNVDPEHSFSPITVPMQVVEMPPFNPAPASFSTRGGTGLGQGLSDLGNGARGQDIRTSAPPGQREQLGPDLSRRAIMIAETRLKLKDFSRLSRRIWQQSERVRLSFIVLADGRPTECKIVETSGSGTLDAEACILVERKLRFHPALDRDGKSSASRFRAFLEYEDML